MAKRDRPRRSPSKYKSKAKCFRRKAEALHRLRLKHSHQPRGLERKLLRQTRKPRPRSFTTWIEWWGAPSRADRRAKHFNHNTQRPRG